MFTIIGGKCYSFHFLAFWIKYIYFEYFMNKTLLIYLQFHFGHIFFTWPNVTSIEKRGEGIFCSTLWYIFFALYFRKDISAFYLIVYRPIDAIAIYVSWSIYEIHYIFFFLWFKWYWYDVLIFCKLSFKPFTRHI